MKKQIIIGLVVALATLSLGAFSASAAGSCCNDGKCSDQQVVQQFTQETATLANTLKAKDAELRQLSSYEGSDLSRVAELEAQIRDLKGQIKVVAQKYGLPACCVS
jgi:peptidoglycan hydrolase CwlO-like protein